MADLTVYNRYSRPDGWKMLEFLPGRRLQAAELNELQSIISDEQAQLGRYVFKDGAIVRGCEVLITGTSAQVSEGQLYWGGHFHDFAGGTVTITGVGEEVIGVRFTAQEVTEAQDASLLDPAQGSLNFGQPGAWRRTYLLELVANDEQAVALYHVRDGVVLQPSSQDTALFNLLARRTRDESGSYLVWGLRSTVEALDATRFNLVTAAGKAYIEGWEIDLPAAMRTPIDRPLAAQTVINEIHTYQTGTNLYSLNSAPVKAISQVTARVQVTENLVKGAPGSAEALSHTPVVSIVSIGGYVQGTDYQRTGNYVDWSLNGAEPTQGTTYSVTYTYEKVMVAGVDYQKIGDQVDFSPTGDNPVNGTDFQVTYDAYLARYDLVTMAKDGTIAITEGYPSVFPSEPSQPPATLLLATVYYPPNASSDQVVVTDSALYRQTMADLARLKQRVDNLEYDIAVSDLEQQAFNVQLSTSKKGIFTDVFRDLSKADLGHSSFNASVDGQTLAPSFSFAAHDVTGVNGGVVTRDYSEVAFMSQSWATEFIGVNPWAVFNSAATITLNPPDDHWIDDQTITVWDQTVSPLWVTNFWNLFPKVYLWGNPNTTTETTSVDSSWVEGTSRAQTITVVGSGFTPGSDNLALRFDGLSYPLTPLTGYSAGVAPGSMRADGNGGFRATFNLPAGIPGGAKGVTVSNINDSAETQFDIGHLKRTTTVRRTTTRIDPVAQTFVAPDDMALAAVDLYFGAKDSTKPVYISVRNVVNGYPGQDVLAERTLTPAQVNVSGNGAVATHVVFERPAFLDRDGEYALVIATESINYSIAVARLGHKDMVSGQPIAQNANSGVLFTSSNAAAWSADQAADLKFRLYRAGFTNNLSAFDTVAGTRQLLPGSTITFDPMTVAGSVIYLLSDQNVPGNCGVKWEISFNNSGIWSPIEPGKTVELSYAITAAQLRVTLSGSDLVSPLLALPASLVVMKWNASGAYIGRNVNLSAFTSLLVYADLNLPTGTDVTAYYSIDGGTTWTSAGSRSDQGTVSDGYDEWKWSVSGLASPSQFRVRLNLAGSTDQVRVPRVRRLRAIAT